MKDVFKHHDIECIHRTLGWRGLMLSAIGIVALVMAAALQARAVSIAGDEQLASIWNQINSVFASLPQ